MRSRPAIEIHLPEEPTSPGGRLHVRVSLTTRSKTPVDAIVIHFSGSEAHRPRSGFAVAEAEALARKIEAGDDTPDLAPPMFEHELVSSIERVPGRTLTPGVHTFEATFSIPADAPPSTATVMSHIAYRVAVTVEIPWWPDASHTVTVPVTATSTPEAIEAPPPPTRHTSDAGPQRGRAWLEAAITPGALAPGGTIAGAFAVTFPGGEHADEIEIAALVHEGSRAFPEMKRPIVFQTKPLRFTSYGEGETVPFTLTLPPYFPCTLETQLTRVVTSVRVAAIYARGEDVALAIPISVTPRTPAPNVHDRLPLLGIERRVSAWEAVGVDLGARGIRVVDCAGRQERLVATHRGLCVVLEAAHDARRERRLRFTIDRYFASDGAKESMSEAIRSKGISIDFSVGETACLGATSDLDESARVLANFADTAIEVAGVIADVLATARPAHDPDRVAHLSELRRIDGVAFRSGDLALSNVYVDDLEVGFRFQGASGFGAWVASPALEAALVTRIGDALGRPVTLHSDRVEIAIEGHDPRPLWIAAARIVREALASRVRSPYR